MNPLAGGLQGVAGTEVPGIPSFLGTRREA